MATTKTPVATGSAWDAAVLRGIDAPVTKTNLMFMALWRRFEGGPADNPLNTSLSTSQATGTVNSSGVKRYASVQAGIEATVATLKGGYYSNVVSELRRGASLPQLATAVQDSPWDAGHYGAVKRGNYFIGGNLWKAAVGEAQGAPIKRPGLGTALGDAAHYAAHPLAGTQKTGSAAVSAAKGSVGKDIGKWILYGTAVAGGMVLVVVGFILVAADLGVSRLNSHPAVKTGRRVSGAFGSGGDDGGDSGPSPDEAVAAAYAKGEQQGRESRARSLGRKRASRSLNDAGRAQSRATNREASRAKKLAADSERFGEVPY